MQELIVCKFGGTSLADAQGFRRVRDIVLSDPRRRYVVVSAPGKRRADDRKITDVLISAYEGGGEAALETVRERFGGIARELELSMPPEMECLKDAVAAGRDAAASMGEKLCARMMAEFLDVPFVDAAEIFKFRDSRLDKAASYAALSRLPYRAVIPGFYGADTSGNIVTFPRGGSDISASHVAAALDAAVYENWTDVEGFFTADPAAVPDARRIRHMSGLQAQLFAALGAGVMHSESIAPAARAGVPIQVRSTFAPDDEGTLIASGAHCDIPFVTARKNGGIWHVFCANITGDIAEMLLHECPEGSMRGRIFCVMCAENEVKTTLRRLHRVCLM